MKHAELFAGYGGLSLAVEAVFDAELAWYAEFDPAPSKIMARHWPDVPNHGDVTTLDWSEVEPVDIISGGSPCQDVSAAGRRAGMTDGTRSNLWVAMRESIATIKPTYVIWENVRGAHSAKAHSQVESEPGLLGAPGDAYLRATGRVLGDLAQLGYDAEWRTIPASAVGAPHRRERVFILAWRRDTATADAMRTGSRRRNGPSGSGEGARPDVAAVVSTGASGGTGSAEQITLLPTPNAYLVRKGGSQHPDKQRAGGHQVDLSDVVEHVLLPTVTTSDTNGTGAHGAGGADLRTTINLLPTPKAGDGDFGLPRTSGRPPEKSTHLATRLAYTDFGDYAPAIERWEQILGRPAPPPTELSPRGKHRLSEHFTEWMMGLPAGWICDTPGVSRKDAIKAAGNGVVPQQAAAALRDMTDQLPGPAVAGPF